MKIIKHYTLLKLKKFIKKNNLIFISCNLKHNKNIHHNFKFYKIKNSLAMLFFYNSIFKNLITSINGTTLLIKLKNKIDNNNYNLLNLSKFNFLGYIFNNNIYYFKIIQNTKTLNYQLTFLKIYNLLLKVTKNFCVFLNKFYLFRNNVI